MLTINRRRKTEEPRIKSHSKQINNVKNIQATNLQNSENQNLIKSNLAVQNLDPRA